jgi:hypothetical protein
MLMDKLTRIALDLFNYLQVLPQHNHQFQDQTGVTLLTSASTANHTQMSGVLSQGRDGKTILLPYSKYTRYFNVRNKVPA